ncbi:MAG: hypothetical protein MI674_05920, partial [Cytophagales bacterium]|nr:hypothetical protein [Cytophagales bacterium]
KHSSNKLYSGPVESFPNFSKNLLLKPIQAYNLVEFFKILQPHSLHEPGVYAVSKGKAHKPYEYGCKVSLTVTHKQGFALSAQALASHQYDGHSLSCSLSSAERLSGRRIKQVYVDKGVRHDVSRRKYSRSEIGSRLYPIANRAVHG